MFGVDVGVAVTTSLWLCVVVMIFTTGHDMALDVRTGLFLGSGAFLGGPWAPAENHIEKYWQTNTTNHPDSIKQKLKALSNI